MCFKYHIQYHLFYLKKPTPRAIRVGEKLVVRKEVYTK